MYPSAVQDAYRAELASIREKGIFKEERFIHSPQAADIRVEFPCGAQLKDYGHLLGTDDARAFSARVQDVHEWLAPRMHLLPSVRRPVPGIVAVQDPCHLRHVQRSHLPVRADLGVIVRPGIITLFGIHRFPQFDRLVGAGGIDFEGCLAVKPIIGTA